MSDTVFACDRGDAGRRLDLVLRRHLADVDSATRTRVQRWIESGCVAVNGRAVRRVSARAAFGDVVEVAIPEADAPRPRRRMSAEDAAIDVLYEDSHLLIVDKPAGMIVHPSYKHAAGTLMNALLWHARAWPDDQRPSLVGRLDKQTSGLVVVAKTPAAHAALQRTLSASGSEKDYLALVYGRVRPARGEIDLRLRTDPGDRRRTIASPTTGAASLTKYERLDRAKAPPSGLALMRCRLVTGRTHQIRVHLAANGWPIVGDAKYLPSPLPPIGDPALAAVVRAFPRQALHAWRLAFAHPITRVRVEIAAPVPDDLVRLFDATGVSLR